MAGSNNIWILAADNDVGRLVPILRADPALASSQDFSGYSLVHAAASYGHVPLLRQLVNEFHVDVNIQDHDEETALFQVENVEVANVLVEQLNADKGIRNNEGMTAAEKIESEGDWPLVAAYLLDNDATASGESSTRSMAEGQQPSAEATEGDNVRHAPPLPPNVSIDVGTMEELAPADDAVVDPELRRRIEDLASREDFQSEAGQSELRDLITAAVRGHVVDGNADERDTRRRTD
ncbi:MAG: hypothetical protein M4579_001037 [Chaenotheca gracillima]|nr:MAG: hypothetical protein M4579_001037 [Chaenotheca gracillima]